MANSDEQAKPVSDWLTDGRRRLMFAGSAALAILLIAMVTYMASQTVREAWSLAIGKQAETYTELYLDNNTHLPTSSPTGKPHTFAFHLTNHEGRTVTYQYTVTMSFASQSILVSRGSITLAPDQGKDTPVTFTIPQPSLKPTITVKLTGRTEYVQFKTES